MAVSGLPERCNDHARKICNMALDMIEIVKEINTQERKIQVSHLYTYSILLLSSAGITEMPAENATSVFPGNMNSGSMTYDRRTTLYYLSS